MLNIIIVDDEKPARDELHYLLSRFPDLQIIAECDSGETAITQCTTHKPHVIFLDIKLRGLSGIETAKIIRQLAPQTLIVFATAYDEYALSAFDLHAVDYLLKPFDDVRLAETIQRIKTSCRQDRKTILSRIDEMIPDLMPPAFTKLAAEKDGHIKLIDTKDIIYIQIADGVVEIVTITGPYQYRDTLDTLQHRLQSTLIRRVHRSYLVNLDKIQEVVPWFKGTYWLKVPQPERVSLKEIPVSKTKIKAIKEILGI